MSIVIITGGIIQDQAVKTYMEGRSVSHIIAVDGGVDKAEKLLLCPDYIVGDFDTLVPEKLEKYKNANDIKIQQFQPEKDDTDTQIAVELAIKLAGERKTPCENFQEDIIIFGALGKRFDHALANVLLLEKFASAGLCACIVDEYNRISVHRQSFSLEKSCQYGTYVSFLALTPLVTGITLTGFKYPLTQHTLKQEDSLCISNELVKETGTVSFLDGILLMVESRD